MAQCSQDLYWRLNHVSWLGVWYYTLSESCIILYAKMSVLSFAVVLGVAFELFVLRIDPCLDNPWWHWIPFHKGLSSNILNINATPSKWACCSSLCPEKTGSCSPVVSPKCHIPLNLLWQITNTVVQSVSPGSPLDSIFPARSCQVTIATRGG